MLRDVSRLDPSPKWAVRGEEGLGPAHPTPVLCVQGSAVSAPTV